MNGEVVNVNAYVVFATLPADMPTSGCLCGPPAGETTRNRAGGGISQAIERYALFSNEPEAARFARLETKAVQRPQSGVRSVSEVRTLLPNPFETTRKLGVVGVAVRVCDGKLAEGMGFEPTVRRVPPGNRDGRQSASRPDCRAMLGLPMTDGRGVPEAQGRIDPARDDQSLAGRHPRLPCRRPIRHERIR